MFHHLHGAGCLPVNSAMTRQNPQLAYTIRNQTSVIMPPPHRGIHHAKSFLTKQHAIVQYPA
ncbi:hypothetical protein CFI09_14245 [Escherichia coli]|nr:hypothetical protein CFI09_14245 [Escherichia coli]